MEVRVELEVGRAERKHDDRAALAAALGLVAGEAAPVGPEHRAHEDSPDVRQALTVIGDAAAQLMRDRQHPLAQRNVWQNVVEQVACRLGHPATEARRAETARLAAERDETALVTRGASEHGEAAAEQTAVGVALELLADEGVAAASPSSVAA